MNGFRPLANPHPLPSEVNAAIAVAGREVYHGQNDKKVGDEWAEGYKASYHGNKLAGRKEGIRNKIEVRYYLWIFYFLTFSFH